MEAEAGSRPLDTSQSSFDHGVDVSAPCNSLRKLAWRTCRVPRLSVHEEVPPPLTGTQARRKESTATQMY